MLLACCSYINRTFAARIARALQPSPPSHERLSRLPELRLTLLCQKKSVALLDGNAVPAVLVVGREAGRVRALGDLSVDDLLQGVDALGRIRGVGDVHEMHGGGV